MQLTRVKSWFKSSYAAGKGLRQCWGQGTGQPHARRSGHALQTQHMDLANRLAWKRPRGSATRPILLLQSLMVVYHRNREYAGTLAVPQEFQLMLIVLQQWVHQSSEVDQVHRDTTEAL
jgi:hypothetical protein